MSGTSPPWSSGPTPLEHRVWNDARDGKGKWERAPAVSLALAKRAGANAVVVSEEIAHRLEALKARLIPDDVDVTVTRDYGETANEKANELLFHLGLATISIVVLIAFAIGWREAVVTLVVIPTTILLTLFAANLMGYTINRVSLFALIFSIGILVDDAIVVVENIARHWAMKDGRPRLQAAIEAVAEVGNPTIVATLTVVAALLPMLFVSGLMGPYMAPIPANASAAMLFSFFVAMVVAPWLMLRLAPKDDACAARRMATHDEGALGRLYRRVATPIVAQQALGLDLPDRRRRRDAAVVTLFATKSVTVKLLPFDNKSEIAVVVDLPEGASLEDTERTLFAAADDRPRPAGGRPRSQAYAGTPAPFNFNGLVRHYYLRERPELGELQVNLAARGRAQARQPRHRARSARAAARPSRCPPAPASRWSKCRPDRRCWRRCWPRSTAPTPTTRRAVAAEVQEDLRRRALHRRYRRFDRRSRGRGCGCRSTRTGWSSSASSSATSTTPSRRCSAASRSAIRIAARTAIRSRSRSGCRSATSPGPRRWPRRRCPPTRCPAARPWSNWARS